MSTKIYDGIAIKKMTLPEFNDWCMSLRSELQEIARKQYYRGLVRIAASIFIWQKTDMNLCPYWHALDVQKLTERTDNPKEWDARSVYAYADHLAKQIARKSANAKNMMDNEPDFDYTTSLSVFTVDDQILAIPYTTNQPLKDCILENEAVMDYGYWNNTDHPNNLTDEDWDARENLWNKVFAKSGIPANCGMSIVLLDNDSVDWWGCPDDDFITNYILPHLKSEEEYCRAVAEQKISDRKWEEMKSQRDAASEAMSIALEIRDYIKEHPDVVEEEMKTYIGTLDFKQFLLEGFEYNCTNS